MEEQVPFSTSPQPYRLTVNDFLGLDAAGAFDGLGKTELIRGEVFFLNSQHRPHARMKGHLHLALVEALKALNTGIAVLIEATVAMPPHNAPEPDLILTREPEGDGPVPLASVQLLVEIADSTLDRDLGIKAGIYAENGVPEYWVIDLKAGLLHQMWAPSGDAYAEARQVALGEEFSAITVEGLAIMLPVAR